MKTHNIPYVRANKKIPLLCLLIWRYDQNSLARSTPVSNIFSWFQRCSSHWKFDCIRVANKENSSAATPDSVRNHHKAEFMKMQLIAHIFRQYCL